MKPEAVGPDLWARVESLGEGVSALPLLLGWAAALRARPGEVLVLEQEAGPGTLALRARGRRELLATGVVGERGSPFRLEPLTGTPPPLGGAPGSAALGRVLWASAATLGRDLVSRTGRVDLSPRSALHAQEPEGEERWVVQALLRSSFEGELGAACRWEVWCATAERAVQVRDRVGTALASDLGATFEAFAPGSAAHRAAAREVELRSVQRIWSGPIPPPPPEVLARPWRVPPARSTPSMDERAMEGASSGVALPPSLHVGTIWATGGAATIELTSLLRHVAVVGMTGSGKSQLLSHLAAETVARWGIPFVLFDLHGDLGPATIARLGTGRSERVVVIDATRRPGHGLLGMDVLESGPSDGEQEGEARNFASEEDLLAGEVLSALRPAGGGGEEFWGPRMERFLETGLRAAIQTRGNLRDVAELLYHPLERAPELAAGVRNPALADSLREWPGLLRRQPDLLASSQNRLSKVLLSPRVAALVAAEGRSSVEPGALLRQGRSLIVHLPKGRLGEGNALFVANLLLARTFLGMLRSPPRADARTPSVLFVLDEAQGFSPRLLRSIVEEGRKFRAACVFATQSPGRLQDLLGRAPVDAAGTLVALRLPPSDAARVVLALRPVPAAEETRRLGGTENPASALVASLSSLPPHSAWVLDERTPHPELVRLPGPFPGPLDPELWARASERSAEAVRDEGDVASSEADRSSAVCEAAVRELLLRAFHAEAAGGPLDLDGDPVDRTEFQRAPTRWELEMALRLALRRGWLGRVGLAASEEGRVELTHAGWVRLGYQEDLGAPRESAEHRRLLRAAFQVLALEGYVLELPRQGHLDRSTPDALLPILPTPRGGSVTGRPLPELLAAAERAKRGPLWELTGGRDLHVEAEVSGCRDPDRLRRSLQKVRGGRALVLFLVGSTQNEARLRRFLRQEGAGPERARVWVLPPGRPDGRYDYTRPEFLEGWRNG